MNRRNFLNCVTGAASFLASRELAFGSNLNPAPTPLPGAQIPQFVDELVDANEGGVLSNLEIVRDQGKTISLYMREFLSPVMPSTFRPASGTYNGTYVWGYRTTPGTSSPDRRQSFVGPMIVATKGKPSRVRYVNQLGAAGPRMRLSAWQAGMDQSLMWADPNAAEANVCSFNGGIPSGSCVNDYVGLIPTVPHLHGGEVPPELDGGPDSWFTGASTQGFQYSQGHAFYTQGKPVNGEAIYRYPNSQDAAMLWFHDHTLGITRLNVYAGLAGAYLIQDPTSPIQDLPPAIPMIIQDRMFDQNGQLYFPNAGINPEHPFWIPEFVGDTIVVNGKAWPYRTVNQQRYCFQMVNGSHARSFNMNFSTGSLGSQPPKMWVISTDGGFLDRAVLIDPLSTNANVSRQLLMMPGERYMVIVDFSGCKPNERFVLLNDANTPYPSGDPVVPTADGRIMQFRISNKGPVADKSFDPATSRALLRKTPIVRLVNPVNGTPARGVVPSVKRLLTLNEISGAGGPLEVVLNNTRYRGIGMSNQTTGTVPADAFFTSPGVPPTYYSEILQEGAIEQWDILNTTEDAHPIHLHAAQFQLMNRQAYDAAAYGAVYDAAYGSNQAAASGPPAPVDSLNAAGQLGGNPDVTPFLAPGVAPAGPLPQEAGWKDTVVCYPGQVTRLLVRWAPSDKPLTAPAAYAFSPGGHGYVWHCHIMDHEDNGMMRPTYLKPSTTAVRTYLKGRDY